ncbi:peptidase S8 [Ralstonia sp. A12]|uniref:S8 family peptidase n=1 Tax=Ralstonia sp. A12 TaxID=1217052 RepID=UPI000573F2AD|nr:S8 family peptidase [Ralstonia sp. A12]KHK49101.1 peptidase S8 [Ralstonia sp. A12]
MKITRPIRIVQACIATSVIAYPLSQAIPANKVTTTAARIGQVSQLIVKEKNVAFAQTELAAISSKASAAHRVDVVTIQRWSAAAQMPMAYKRPMSDGAHVVRLPHLMSVGDAQTIASRMEASGQFEYVSVDHIWHTHALASDPLFESRQWNLMSPATVPSGANVTTAWDKTTGNPSVVVGVVDTGLLPGHADLAGAMITPGFDFISNTAMTGQADPQTGQAIPNGFTENDGDNGRDADPSDPGDWISDAEATSYPVLCGGASASTWHGTFVAGQIVAQRNNGIGIAGIAPGVRLQMARAMGKCGGETSDIIDAINWLTGGSVPGVPDNSTPVKVVNASIGGGGPCSSAVQSTIDAVRARGASIVASAGNDADVVNMPANCRGVIAVTAHTFDGDKADYANMGPEVAISAPGGGNGAVIVGAGARIVSLSNFGASAPIASPAGDAYILRRGTSMSAPQVTAAIALMLSVTPTLAPDEITALLAQSARPYLPGTYCALHLNDCGAGMLDVGAAVALAGGQSTLHVAPSATTGTVGNTITLTAVGVAGPGKSITGISWAQTAGPAAMLTTSTPDANGTAMATFTPAAAGTYAFTVTLTSSDGSLATDMATITITAAAIPGETGGVSKPGSGGTPTESRNGGGGHVRVLLAVSLLVAGLASYRGRRTDNY